MVSVPGESIAAKHMVNTSPATDVATTMASDSTKSLTASSATDMAVCSREKCQCNLGYRLEEGRGEMGVFLSHSSSVVQRQDLWDQRAHHPSLGVERVVKMIHVTAHGSRPLVAMARQDNAVRNAVEVDGNLVVRAL